MSKSGLFNANFSMSIDSNESSLMELKAEGGKILHIYPADIGSGYTQYFPIIDEIILIRECHKFQKNPSTPKISLKKLSVQFKVPMFTISIIHSGNTEINLEGQNAKLIREPGIDIFARLDKYEINKTIFTKSNLLTTTLVIPEATITKYIGHEKAEALYKNLGVTSINTFPGSPLITDPFIDIFTENLEPRMRILYAQSKVLQYLMELSIYASSLEKFLKKDGTKKFQIHDLHHMLENSEGSIPSLSNLSKKFGISSAKLNSEFIKTYNESIYSYIWNLRLFQAYKALTATDLPMKTIAHKIGYSHVNHFIFAFKKRFGVTPGSLRKKV
jgi:AraC-like DNA-binding protein